MIHIDLFSGIGGFAYASDQVWNGVEHIFCEIDPFCQQVLKKHWKGSVIYGDIKQLRGEDIWKKLRQRKTQDGLGSGEKETQKRLENIGENIHIETEKLLEKKIGFLQRNEDKKTVKSSSITTEVNASAAGKQLKSSLTSITKTMTETLKERNLEKQEHIEELLKRGFQTHTNFYATTAISQNQSMENAHMEVQIDLLTAGVPCQPASQAGKRRGTKDDRWLWGEAFRIIRETKPRFVILENVRGILTLESGMVFKSLLAEMEGCGYETRAYIIPAVAVNAPHRRDRVWFVAHSRCERQTKQELKTTGSEQYNSHAPDTGNAGLEGWSEQRQRLPGQQDRDGCDKGRDWGKNWIEVATELCGVDDGLPVELDGFKLTKARHRVERLKALGNSIVPQVAIEIMRGIKFSV